ncbi:MAG TPA: hypothetical protein VLV83_17350 [Acidobacteriota bacterium]|nr:hypothetical protein [Acidobacteriota bacterium]
MRRTVCIALFTMLLATLQAQDGVMRSFNGRTFTFGFLQPAGWMINNEAAQLAHFVLHKEGVSWRQAPAILFVRLVRREDGPAAQDAESGRHGEEGVRYEDLESFVKSNVESFKSACPHFEIKDVEALSHANLAHEFIVKSYDCPGMRHEITAVAEFPDYFVLLVLSSRTPENIQEALPKYEEVLSSFYWRQRQPVSEVPDNR